MPDHVHLCLSIPPKYSVANTVGRLKGKSAVSKKEKELGITLPETYKEFLRVSNGWILDELMLSPVEGISWTFSAEQVSYFFGK